MRMSLVLSCLLVVGTGVASATQCNIDLTNTGAATAYGVTITLPGVQSINLSTGIYSGGSSDDVFSHVTIQTVGGNTVITWTDPASPYTTSSVIQGHVGFTPSSGNCNIVAFSFTDQSGNPLPGYGLPYVEVHWQENQVVIYNNYPYPVTVVSPLGAIMSAIPLADLNRTNATLSSNEVSLGSSDELAAGGTVSFPWHGPWPPCYECPNFTVLQLTSAYAAGRATFFVEMPTFN
jgi:hypothetical protein